MRECIRHSWLVFPPYTFATLALSWCSRVHSHSHSLPRFRSARIWSHRRRPTVSAPLPKLSDTAGHFSRAAAIVFLLVHVQSVQLYVQFALIFSVNVIILNTVSFLCAAKKKVNVPRLPKEAFEQQPTAAT